MKYFYPLFLLLCLPQLAGAQDVSRAWFTDAVISNSTISGKPVNALPDANGTIGKGVSLTNSVGIDSQVLQQPRGMISFWIKPNWDGNDGLTHKFLSMGDPTSNGILIEKSAEGFLRFVMASPTKVAAARYTVADWKAGSWHHVEVSWKDSPSLGIALWLDKVCVDSCIFSGDTLMNPTTMIDKKVYVGDTSSNADMDELIFRKELYGWDPWSGDQLSVVYRDYFRTAPFTAIKIDYEPNLVRSDKRVVKGSNKQFGLLAMMEGKWVRITDFAVRYGNWADFDAKPFITWITSNTSIATVNYNGLASGINTGNCTLTANLRGMTATYDINVISNDQPDLDLMYVERLPRYSKFADQIWPEEGQTVQSVVHVGNFGFRDVPAGTVVKFELISDANGNFVADPEELPFSTQTATVNKVLTPREDTTVEFSWQWTMQPVFVRVTLDPADGTHPNGLLNEICEANNQRCELNIARAFHWGYDTAKFDNDYNNKHLNLAGSFSDYDWCNSETDRMALLMREAIWPTTSPVGIKDSIRVDQFTKRVYGDWESEPWVLESDYYDGGFPDMEPENSTPMDFDAAIGHEIGHTTLGLPDLYGHPHTLNNVFVKDDNGNLYAGTKYYPAVNWGNEGMYTTGTYHYSDQLALGYSPLMVFCHGWIHPANAGISNYFAQKRKGLAEYGVDFGYFIPENNSIKVLDLNDEPLKGAAIYIYQMVNTGEDKYLPGWPKFIGNAGDDGTYSFPHMTAPTWDDWTTDGLDGSVYVSNPFSRSTSEYAWGPSWKVGEYFVMKIVSGDQIEFRTLTLTDFNEAFFSGKTGSATYPIHTNLTPVSGTTPIVIPAIPNIKGTVRGIDGKPMAGAIVGIKDSPYATADAKLYLTTDQDGNYGPLYMYPGSCYVAAWRDGFAPTEDTYVTVADGETATRDLQLTKLAGKNLIQNSQLVSASNSDGEWAPPTFAVDGDRTTGWQTIWWPEEPAYFYIDLGKPTDINGITIYRFLERNPYGGSADDYTIDVMSSGTPLDAESWWSNSTVRNVYSAYNTIHGYPVKSDLAADPINLQLTGVQGIRLSFSKSHWPPVFDIREIVLHSTTEYEGVGYGCVRDTSGAPIYNAVVQLGEPDTSQTIITDKSGLWQYVTEPGSYKLYADAPGYAGKINDITITGDGTPLSRDIILAPKQEAGQYNGNFELADASDSSKADGWEMVINDDGLYPNMYGIGRLLTNTTPGGEACGAIWVGTKSESDPWVSAWLKPTTNHWVPIDPTKTYNFYFNAMKNGYAVGFWKLVWRNASGSEIGQVSCPYGDWVPQDTWTPVYEGDIDGVIRPMMRMTPPAGAAWAEVQAGFIDWDPTDVERGGTTFIDDIVVDEFSNTYSEVKTLADLKKLNDGVSVLVKGRQITALPGLGIPADTAYIENIDRSCGIRIDLSALGGWDTTVGKAVNVSGQLATTPDGERYILVSQMDGATNTKLVQPLLANNRATGGCTLGNQAGIWEWRWVKNASGKKEYKLLEAAGINNTGVLVRVYGKITQIDPDGQYFYVDDGTKADDGTYTGDVRNRGIRVACDGRGYTVGSFTPINGVISCFKHTDGKLRRLIRPVHIEN